MTLVALQDIEADYLPKEEQDSEETPADPEEHEVPIRQIVSDKSIDYGGSSRDSRNNQNRMGKILESKHPA